jgi:uncharacterized membrane protein YbaN (DUF454 family)
MKITKIALIITGFLFLALGIIGIAVPVLPTTPFLLVSSYCFLKSSERLYKWVMAHPLFGPRLLRFKTQGLSKKEKIGICALTNAMVIPVIVLAHSIPMRVFLIALLALQAFVFTRIKTAPSVK